MAELVEHGEHIVNGLQGRSTFLGRQSHVAHIGYDGLHAHGAIIGLCTEASAPCTGTLTIAWEHIAIEDGNEVALLVDDIPALLLLVILGIVLGALAEGDAIELCGCPEDTLHHIVNLKVFAHLCLADVELLLLGLVQIVHIVPRLGLALDSILAHHLADVVEFALGSFHGGSPNLVEQVVDILGLLGHASLQLHVGKGVETLNLCQLQTQLYDLSRDGLVVVLVAVVATVVVHLVHLTTKVAVLGILEHGVATGALHVETVLPLSTSTLCQSSSLLYVAFRQAFEVLCIGNGDIGVVCVVQEVLCELQLQLGQLKVDFGNLLLGILAQESTATHKTLVGLIQKALLLGVEVQGLHFVVHGLDTLEQGLVHIDIVAMSREHGREFAFQLLILWCGA